MDLDANQKKIFEDFLADKTPLKKCPACGGQNFSPSDKLFTPIAMDGPTTIDLTPGPTSVFPMLAAGCTNCGYLMFFSNHVVGV